MRPIITFGLALLSTPAGAATLVVDSGPLSTIVTVQQFDPLLGTLTSISGESTGQATYRFTFNQAAVLDVDYDVRNFFGIYMGPTFFDTTLFGVGTVDIVGNQAEVTTSGSGVDVRTDDVILNYFTGLGTR